MSFDNHADNGLTFSYLAPALVAPHEAWIAVFDGGPEVKAVKRSNRDTFRVQYAKARIYGALDTLVPELMAQEPHTDIVIPLVQETELEKQQAKEWSAWKRNTTKEAKARLLPILSALFGREVSAKELRFSATAGCSCPCSPGFIFDGREPFKVDLWISK